MGNSKRSVGDGKRGRQKAKKATLDSVSPPAFETALEALETSVARLEEGEMPLEEALELFESGVKLSRQCQSTLQQAERRIEILVGDRATDGEAAERVVFESEEGWDDNNNNNNNDEDDDDEVED